VALSCGWVWRPPQASCSLTSSALLTPLILATS
jgi:hypothetical protein